MIKVPLHATLRSGAQIDSPQKGVVSKKQTNPRPLRRIGPVANTDTKLLIYGLFQKSRVWHRTRSRTLSRAQICPHR